MFSPSVSRFAITEYFFDVNIFDVNINVSINNYLFNSNFVFIASPVLEYRIWIIPCFYKQRFYTQHQVETCKMSSNSLRLNLCYLKIMRFLHSCCHPKLIWDILRNVLKTKASVLMRLCDCSWTHVIRILHGVQSLFEIHELSNYRKEFTLFRPNFEKISRGCFFKM